MRRAHQGDVSPSSSCGIWRSCAKKSPLSHMGRNNHPRPSLFDFGSFSGTIWWNPSYNAGRIRSFMPASTMTNFLPGVFLM